VSPKGPTLRTARLILRRWQPADLAPLAALNADPEVMEYFLSTRTLAESAEAIDRIEANFERQGFGLWAAEVPGVSPLIGFIGLTGADFDAHFTPAVEVGWRLARPYWGHGYATEGATAALRFGFEEAGLDEIVSFTAEINQRSRRVMERLGMTHTPEDDFDHPRMPAGHRLRRHVLYRIGPDGGERGREEPSRPPAP
jgi:RimJ/RimL family protein N-acetyltransferase